jgi:hypothetical protein
VIALRHDGGRVRAVRIRTAARPSSAWSPNLVRSFTVRSWTGCRTSRSCGTRSVPIWSAGLDPVCGRERLRGSR